MRTNLWLLSSSLYFTTLLVAQENQTNGSCGQSPHPMRSEVRHIEAEGVGYKEGYTTLEGFFSLPSSIDTHLVPFLDLRGHIFNNGKPAANAGIGLRYISSRVWGVNTYYDFRKTHRVNYNQVSAGLESLGRIWDFRVNGYLPVGRKKSELFDQRSTGSFRGHHLIISSKREYAMKGVNAEAGAHIKVADFARLYAAAGPYYFTNEGKNAWGGEARVACDLTDYVRAEVRASYDPVFNGIVQGQLSLVFPFGGKKEISAKKGRSCSKELALRARAVQRVDRNEIIVVDKKRKNNAAINPLTNKPYFFWFVDNTSHSKGTFESPFPTLSQAEAASKPSDIIYVYPGDGTTSGMDLGFLMKDNQKILGSGLAYAFDTTRGVITVAAQSSKFPLITNTQGPTTNSPTTPGVGIITLANSCEVAGLQLTTTTKEVYVGILGGEAIDSGSFLLGPTNTFIHDNIISGANIFEAAIYLHNCSGELIVQNNSISNINSTVTGLGHGLEIAIENIPLSYQAAVSNNSVTNLIANGAGMFFINTADLTSQVSVTNNVISKIFNGVSVVGVTSVLNTQLNISQNSITNATNGVQVIETNGNLAVNVANNQIATCSASGMIIRSSALSPSSCSMCVNVSGNETSAATIGLVLQARGAATVNASVNGNSFVGDLGLKQFRSQDSGKLCLSCTNNTTTTGYAFQQVAASTFNREPLVGNVGSVINAGTIVSVPSGTCSCP